MPQDLLAPRGSRVTAAQWKAPGTREQKRHARPARNQVHGCSMFQTLRDPKWQDRALRRCRDRNSINRCAAVAVRRRRRLQRGSAAEDRAALLLRSARRVLSGGQQAV